MPPVKHQISELRKLLSKVKMEPDVQLLVSAEALQHMLKFVPDGDNETVPILVDGKPALAPKRRKGPMFGKEL